MVNLRISYFKKRLGTWFNVIIERIEGSQNRYFEQESGEIRWHEFVPQKDELDFCRRLILGETVPGRDNVPFFESSD